MNKVAVISAISILMGSVTVIAGTEQRLDAKACAEALSPPVVIDVPEGRKFTFPEIGKKFFARFCPNCAVPVLVGPQSYLNLSQLEIDEVNHLQLIAKMATDSESKMRLKALQKNSNEYVIEEILKEGIEVGVWRLTLFNGLNLWSEPFTSYSPNHIDQTDSNKSLSNFLKATRLQTQLVTQLSFYHFHPNGTPLSPSDLERFDLGHIPGVSKQVNFSMNAIVIDDNRIGLFRSQSSGLNVSSQKFSFANWIDDTWFGFKSKLSKLTSKKQSY